jgi:23S rRNA U2552 (ribose-2'-O)-methylase RlmE/FtsJ
MVKKIILEINDDIDSNIIETVEELLDINSNMYDLLTKYKNKITDYYNNKSWDRYKKISNEYEMIFTTPNTGFNLSQYTPVSRSFFKMWEMLHDFREEFNFPDKMRVCMLCEGPGGFAEALVKYRDTKASHDEYHGISLKSDNNKNIPEWKLNNNFLNKININYGSDGTGNIYNMPNIFHLVNHIGKHTVDFITADGGFDFSSDFNHQEDMSIQLILSEILATLLLQKPGGSFILKIYDIFTENTMKIIHIIKKFYKKIFIVKPLTSRPANSEKYLICTRFKGINDTNRYLISLLSNLVKNYNEHNIQQIMNQIKFNQHILKNLISFNLHYSIRQVFYIERTINYINQFSSQKGSSSNQDSSSEMNLIMNDHIRKSQKWCQKYNIPSQQTISNI